MITDHKFTTTKKKNSHHHSAQYRTVEIHGKKNKKNPIYNIKSNHDIMNFKKMFGVQQDEIKTREIRKKRKERGNKFLSSFSTPNITLNLIAVLFFFNTTFFSTPNITLNLIAVLFFFNTTSYHD